MGALGPFARPNTRRPGEACFLGTARGASGFQLSQSLLFGLPAVDTKVAATGRAVGQGIVAPRVDARAEALGRAGGQGIVAPRVDARAEAVGRATGTGLVSGTSAAVATARGLGVGTGLVSAAVSEVAGVAGASAGSGRVSALVLKGTLYGSLNPAMARLRATLARPIGDRPYRVYLTVVRWDGGAPGQGNRAPVRTELRCGFDQKTGLPQPPKLTRTKPSSWQQDRRGTSTSSAPPNVVYLTQLDPTYTARDLVPYADLGLADEAYVEIENVGAQGGDARTRPVERYTIFGAPWFDQPKMGWVMALLPAEPSKAFGGPR